MVTHVVLAERDDTHSCSHSSQAGVRVGKGLSGTWAVTCVPKGAFCVLSGIRHRQRGPLSTGKILYGHAIGFVETKIPSTFAAKCNEGMLRL
jgi:hypothetical protein